MITPNLFSFNEGYAAEQRLQLADAEERRRQEEAARRQSLFEQAQAEFAANQPVRELERADRLQGLQGGIDLRQVTLPEAVAAARYAATTNDATRQAMLPVVPQVAQAGAATLLDQALAAQTRAGTARTMAGLDAGFLATPGVAQNLQETRVNTAATQATQSALARLVSEADRAFQADPQVRGLAQQATLLANETKLLDSLMQLGRMDQVNKILSQRGYEAKIEGQGANAAYYIRPVGSPTWETWTGAMSLPFYGNYVRNLENAAQAYERAMAGRARETGAQATAPVAALGLGVGGAAPTPLAGRAPAPAPASSAAPTVAPVPQPRLPISQQELAVLAQSMRKQEVPLAPRGGAPIVLQSNRGGIWYEFNGQRYPTEAAARAARGY